MSKKTSDAMVSGTDASRNGEAAVIAHVNNGRSYDVLATGAGLVYCLEGDLEKPNRWQRLPSAPGVPPSLWGLVQKLTHLDYGRHFWMSASAAPNAVCPDIGDMVFENLKSYLDSGFNVFDTRRRVVRFVPPKPGSFKTAIAA